MMKSFGSVPMAFPTPVWCVGTYGENGKPNVMTAAWGGIVCSKPPCLTVSLRKATHSYAAILNRGAYTVSVPSQDYAREADYFGIASGKNTDKFAVSGLTPVRSEFVDAPYVGEFPMVVECRLVHHYELGLHTHFVGEIADVKVAESALGADGKPDMRKVRPIVFAPETRWYYGVGEDLGRAFDIGRTVGKETA